MAILVAHDFTQARTEFGFSVDQKAAVAALRKLADAIEREEAYVTKAVVYQTAQGNEFPCSALVLQYQEATEDGVRHIAQRRELAAAGAR